MKKASSEHKRDQWTNSREFFFSLVGWTVGLGNVWRFPYLCFENGGGAFLLPYLFFVCVVATPMIFMEISMGQFMKRNALKCYDMVPLMKGVGMAAFLTNVYGGIYYTMTIAWCLFYFFESFTTKELPWSSCGNWWNSESCISTSQLIKPHNLTNWNLTNNGTLSVEEYWSNYILQQSSGINTVGTAGNWKLFLCFSLAWVICYLCIFKGIKMIGKIVYFTALFPYLFLFILAIRGVTLPGASLGLKYFLLPNFSKLANPNVWFQAGGQVLYSYGVGSTVMQAMGSYNDFNMETPKYAIGIVVSGTIASITAGLSTFGVLGYLAEITNKTVPEVVSTGPGLAFQMLPAGISMMPLSHVWSILFFFMLVLVGIDTVFGTLESLMCLIGDYFPHCISTPRKRKVTVLCMILVLYLIGLPMTLGNGIYIFELFNKFANGPYCLFMITLLECVTFTYIYGIDNFFRDIKVMIGYTPSNYYKICFKYFIPAILSVLFVASMVKYEPLKVGEYTYPVWAYILGWIMVTSSVILIPTWFLYAFFKRKGSLIEKWRESTKPKYSSHLDEFGYQTSLSIKKHDVLL